MSQEDKLTIREYFEGRLTSEAITMVCEEYEQRFGKPLRRLFVSQVFHFKKCSSKVWECIRSVAMKIKKASIEFNQYFNK